MRSRLARYVLLSVGFALGCDLPQAVVHQVVIGDLTIRYHQVASERVGRTEFEFDFDAEIENGGPVPLGDVQLVVSSSAASTQVVVSQLGFSGVGTGGPTPSDAAFRIRQDRTVPFDPADLGFTLVPGAPALQQSLPADGASDFGFADWPVLTFAAAPSAAAIASLGLDCGTGLQGLVASGLAGGRVVVNPAGDLPADASCQLGWIGPAGPESISFDTAAAGAPLRAIYDRRDDRFVDPFPDDYYLEPDASMKTGFRVELPPVNRPFQIATVFEALRNDTELLDGWSPIGAIVIKLPETLDPATLPLDQEASLDPLSSAALIDLTPGSPTEGQRIPFLLDARRDQIGSDPFEDSLVIFPGIPLTPEGTYGFLLSRRAAAEPGRPLDPSLFFEAVIDDPQPGEPAEVTRLRPIADEVLAAATTLTPPIFDDDVALALRITIRNVDDIPNDMLEIRRQIDALPPPSFDVDSVQLFTTGPDRVQVDGTWSTPDFRTPTNLLNRDGAGLPAISRFRDQPFVLSLPAEQGPGPFPVIMYQHGNPGSAESEVPSQSRRFLADEGYAVIGFTDIQNREIGDVDAQTLAIFATLLTAQQVIDIQTQTYADQISMLKLIQALSTLDVLPEGAPDGIPDLDVSAPLGYIGISYGSVHGQAFMAYAPEVRAAAMVVGAFRLVEGLVHQAEDSGILSTLGGFLPGVTPAELWTGLGIFQMRYDAQDPHNHARFIFERPVSIGGTTQKASMLVTEGIEDPLTPNNASRSLAFQLGVPQLAPAQVPVSYLSQATGPLRGNLDADTSGAYFQFVPSGIAGLLPSPGCEFQPNGHFCPQSASSAIEQRLEFLGSAAAGEVPNIISTLP